MATIDKLRIQGIRSFAPSCVDTIQFDKPLTLIVGQNGAGKTTVIECLKVATCGEMPPFSDLGKSFVHDPKVAGTTEVKAQIRLMFRTPPRDAQSPGMKYMVTRSFQLTQTAAAKKSFKTLDGHVRAMNPDGSEKAAVNERCSEINKLVPQLMGFDSKAILDSVIFVHQEASNWPLADGATLKKHFDEIFASSKYTKALEAITKLRKELLATVKASKAEHEHLKNYLETAERLEKEVRDSRRVLNDYNNKRSRLDTKRELRLKEAKACQSHVRALSTMLDKAETLRTKLSHAGEQKVRTVARIKNFIQIDDETVEQATASGITAEACMVSRLKEQQGVLARSVAEADGKIANCESKAKRIKDQIGALRAESEKLVNKRAQAEAEKRTRVAERKRLCNLVAEVCRLYPGKVGWAESTTEAQCASPPSHFELPELECFERKLVSYVEELRADDAKKEADELAEMERLQEQVDATSAEHSSLLRSREDQSKSLVEKKKKLDALAIRLSDMERLSGGAQAKAHIEDGRRAVTMAEEELKKTSAEVAGRDFEHEMSQFKAQAAKAQAEIESLRSERDSIRSRGEAGVTLRLKQEELGKKRAELVSLLSPALASFRRLESGGGNTADVVPATQMEEAVVQETQQQALPGEAARTTRLLKSLKAEIDSELSRATSSHDAQTSKRATALAQAAQAKAENASAISDLDASRELLENKLRDVLGSSAAGSAGNLNASVDDMQRAKEKELEQSRNSLGVIKASSKLYGVYIKSANENNQCRICERAFGDEASRRDFVEKYENQKNALPQALKDAEAKVQELELVVQGIRSLGPLQARVEEQKTRVAEVQKKAESADAESMKADDAAAQSERTLRAITERHAAAASLEPQLARCLSLEEEVADLVDYVERLGGARAGVDGADTGTRTVRMIDEKIEGLEDDKFQAEHKRETAFKQMTRLRDDEAKARDRVHTAKEELAKREAAQADGKALAEQKGGLEKECEAIRVNVEDVSSRLAPLAGRKTALMSRRDALRSEHGRARTKRQETLGEASGKLNSVRERLATVQRAESSVAESGGVQEIEKQLKHVEGEQTTEQTRLDEMQEEIQELRNEVATSNDTKRAIDDHVEYYTLLEAERKQSDEFDESASTMKAAYDGAVTELNSLRSERLAKESSQDGDDTDGGDDGDGGAADVDMAVDRGAGTHVDDPIESCRAMLTRLRQRESSLRESATNLENKMHRFRGTIDERKQAMKQSEKELEKKQYNDIAKNEMAKRVEIKTTSLAEKDLDAYGKALDRALQEFHASRMEEVNAIIKELWQTTYRNGDIDYIAIRSDVEETAAAQAAAAAAGAAKGRGGKKKAAEAAAAAAAASVAPTRSKSYNYRVVMRQGDTELDMRGRCSAGQKVLACLIIRLALAETFSINCGILALDEPTTNLDAENAESLANALKSIMDVRKENAGFQLIVITHDERFARTLGAGTVDGYWRVYKDSEQHSRLSRVAFHFDD